MASVRKRLLPSGEIRWQADYRDCGGKRRSRQFEKKSEATGFSAAGAGRGEAGCPFAR
jgi:hypothetical protein